jgi:hypothetical protein
LVYLLYFGFAADVRYIWVWHPPHFGFGIRHILGLASAIFWVFFLFGSLFNATPWHRDLEWRERGAASWSARPFSVDAALTWTLVVLLWCLAELRMC